MNERGSCWCSLVNYLVAASLWEVFLLLAYFTGVVCSELRCFNIIHLHRWCAFLEWFQSTSLRPLIIQNLVELMLLLSLLCLQIELRIDILLEYVCPAVVLPMLEELALWVVHSSIRGGLLVSVHYSPPACPLTSFRFLHLAMHEFLGQSNIVPRLVFNDICLIEGQPCLI
jgi:hypothetical protein